VVVDGTGLTAADTEENQEEWPQYKSQEPGCGFPAMRLCALFSLKTGAALGYRIGHRKKHELRLFREMWDLLKPEDICLGDKGFSTFFDMAELAGKGVDSVTTQRTGRRRPVSEKECIKKLGENDLLVEWKRPVWQKKAAYTAEQYEALPETLTLRQIKVEVTQKGFRTKEFHIITTLLDPVDYPAGELAELYLRRWEIELNLDDLKTTMGMDMLRCKTPAMVKKELLMYFIAYNATRWMINNAAIKHQADPMRISFKGALQELRNWDFLLNDPDLTQSDKRKIMDELYRGISQRIVPFRPNRREPRCLKRRPKSYQLLTEHRHTMREIEHRSNYRAKAINSTCMVHCHNSRATRGQTIRLNLRGNRGTDNLHRPGENVALQATHRPRVCANLIAFFRQRDRHSVLRRTTKEGRLSCAKRESKPRTVSASIMSRAGLWNGASR
jgi:hypothetical protein